MAKAKSETLLAGVPGLAGKFSITDEAKTGLLRERANVFVLILCLAFVAAEVLLVVLNFSRFPPQIPLYYSKPWGEAMLTTPIAIWLLPILSFAFIVVNFILAVFIYSSEKFVARVLVFASSLVAFIAFWAVFKIVTLLI